MFSTSSPSGDCALLLWQPSLSNVESLGFSPSVFLGMKTLMRVHYKLQEFQSQLTGLIMYTWRHLTIESHEFCSRSSYVCIEVFWPKVRMVSVAAYVYCIGMYTFCVLICIAFIFTSTFTFVNSDITCWRAVKTPINQSWKCGLLLKQYRDPVSVSLLQFHENVKSRCKDIERNLCFVSVTFMGC